jgi:chorismate--pyruvate lyase
VRQARPHRIEPSWLPVSRLRQGEVSPATLNWLRDQGSLTRRLLDYCEGRFRVDVRRQDWSQPLPGESLLLEMAQRQAAMAREVVLRCDERPWVFARTLIPATTLRGSGRRLAYLRDRPLGAVLFADRRVRRGVLEVARLLPHHVLFRSAVQALDGEPDGLWARRTLFHLEGRPLLVNEVFLPALPDA